MKDIKLHSRPSDCRRFLDQHLKTPEFREACVAQLELRSLMDRFCAFPRLSFTATDGVVERSNFTAWYNALAEREYVSPAVNDLYYLHEIAHIVTMDYAVGLSFEDWREKMFANELDTSVLSESYIYLLCPGLRAKSFAGEIWVDRHLARLQKGTLSAGRQFLLEERRRIQSSKSLTDPQELRIREYQSQNEKWAALWRAKFPEVESQMVSFYELAKRDPEDAIMKHKFWLESKMTVKPYPYPELVDEFSRLTALTKSPAEKETDLA